MAAGEEDRDQAIAGQRSASAASALRRVIRQQQRPAWTRAHATHGRALAQSCTKHSRRWLAGKSNHLALAARLTPDHDRTEKAPDLFVKVGLVECRATVGPNRPSQRVIPSSRAGGGNAISKQEAISASGGEPIVARLRQVDRSCRHRACQRDPDTGQLRGADCHDRATVSSFGHRPRAATVSLRSSATGCETLNECTISVRGSCLIRTASISVGRGGAYAPPLPNCQTEIPSLRALSARLSWMPVPGKTMTPIGITVSMRSLRLNGAALACFVQSGLKAT